MWRHEPWANLSRDEAYAILALRQQVFVVEQHRPCLDADGADAQAWHLWQADDRGIRGYLRWFAPGIRGTEANLGRIATAAHARKVGLGHALVTEGLARIAAAHGAAPIRIVAQQYLEGFYTGHGFVRASDIFVVDAIDHIEMVRA